jgi:mannose-6-phosphate isomerase-like protein (cupin superfamily)
MIIKRKFNLDTPSWEDVIKNLNYSIENNLKVRCNDQGFYVAHDAYRIPIVKKLIKQLKAKDAHVYINFIQGAPTFGKHVDTMDIAFWQIIGKTKWIIDNKSYTLKSGDLIIVQKGTYHEVIPLTPRAGISFGW